MLDVNKELREMLDFRSKSEINWLEEARRVYAQDGNSLDCVSAKISANSNAIHALMVQNQMMYNMICEMHDTINKLKNEINEKD